MRDNRESNIIDTFKDLVGGDTASFKPLVIDNEEDDEDEDEEEEQELYGSSEADADSPVPDEQQ